MVNFFILAFFVADRIFKNFFYNNPALSWDFFGLEKILSFNFAKNYGIAFSFFNLPNSRGWLQWLLIFLIIFCLLIIINFLLKFYRQKDFLYIISLTLIFVGAFSNLIDRFKFGFVIDYLDVPFFTVFNLADVMITVGIFIILIKEFLLKKSS